MFEVTVTARKGAEEVVDTAEGNTSRTAYSAGQALARSYSNDGYSTHVGAVRKVSGGSTVVARGRDGGIVVVAQTRRVDLTGGS